MHLSDPHDLRDLMLAVDVPPTTADVGLAIATGRRQARRGTVLAGAAAVLVVAGGTAYALGGGFPGGSRDAQVAQQRPPEPTLADCTVEQVPGTAPSGIAVVDPAGRTVVGTIGDAVVRVEQGRVVPYPGATGQVVAVNDAGVIIGYDEVDRLSHQLAWSYRDGTKTTLPRLPGYAYSYPRAVNARGDVVGAAMGEAGDDTVPVIWPADRPGTVQPLAMPAAFGYPGTGSSEAVGVLADGTVLGMVRGAPTRWSPDGTPALLALPPGHDLAHVLLVAGGEAYGTARVTGQNRTVAVRWSLSLNMVDVVVGVPHDITGATPDGWLITTDDGIQPLRANPQRTLERLPLPPTGPGGFAASISDDGRTITGATSAADRHLLIWHC